MPKTTKTRQARDYRHDDKKALLRPESGAQDVFPPARRKPRKVYRYDSSLSPELAWDEAEVRGEGEQLIDEIINSRDLDQARRAAEKLKNLSRPFLNWAGKSERERIAVPTLPLFVHERLSTTAVLETLKRHRRDRSQTLDLFGESEKSIGEKIRGAYEHLNGWQNRLILGDSLQVMNSLLEYEGMGRQVQMVYMDPPYGVKFGSNFQPFVRKRDVKEGDDEGLIREPEMVQAYRDTWELGIHSWLTYMRDRLLLAREMLTDSGSCFVQISDENVHHVREIMDEVFGAENFVSLIAYKTTSGMSQKAALKRTGDYLSWYAKDSSKIKFRRLYSPHPVDSSNFHSVKDGKGEIRRITKDEKLNLETLIKNKSFRPCYTRQIYSNSGSDKTIRKFQGEEFSIPTRGSWRYSLESFNNLVAKKRIVKIGNALQSISYYNDFPYQEYTQNWIDTASKTTPNYVVQTNEKVIQRCVLMTTDPGDLVLDPTCGSGTTAIVAEQWGRRWITTDVSRVPLALTRQRLLTATYPYYQLKDEKRGPGGGFVYKRKKNKKGEEVGGIVPHITLRSIANDEPPVEEVLVDKPETESSTIRISGPFCVEAVLPTPLSPEENKEDWTEVKEQSSEKIIDNEKNHVPRMIQVLRLSPILHLLDNKKFNLKNIRPPAKSLSFHAEGENADNGTAVAIVFGPANGAISERAVIEAGKEARHKDYALLLVIAFAIEPAARQTIEQGEKTFGLPAIYAQASTDLVMCDLLKNMRSSQIFSVVGLPDVKLKRVEEKAEDGNDLWQATLRGLDVFDPVTMKTKSLKGDDVPCWMLDTDYDGQCFRAGQVFFPRTSAWDKIHKAINADFDESVWKHLRGATSAPFVAGEQVAVKVIDERGNELMVIKRSKEFS